MTPIEQAVMWAIADLRDCGINPKHQRELTKALAQLYTSLIGEPHERTPHHATG